MTTMEEKGDGKVSECCGAEVKIGGGAPDFVGKTSTGVSTCYFVCARCGEACNIADDSASGGKDRP
jgi:hypothetical protein